MNRQKRGTLKLILGNMFANKTGTLIHEIETRRTFGKQKILVLKPTMDTRSPKGYIKNFHGIHVTAHEIPTNDPWKVFRTLREEEKALNTKKRAISKKFHCIAFDEIQFFALSSGIFRVIDELLAQGYDVLAAGLALDFRGEPFGCTLSLIGLTQNHHDITFLTSRCGRCGKPARLPQRLKDGKPALYEDVQEQVGGKETYEPRCDACFKLPGKQKSPY